MDITKIDLARVTNIDIDLAKCYFPILVSYACEKQTITYGKLIQLAKVLNSNNVNVQNAIAVSTGRRLDVVRKFTNSLNLPDLTSLVIGINSGECGGGFLKSFDPVEARNQVFKFDWNSKKLEYESYLNEVVISIAPRKRISQNAAIHLMSEYYYLNKNKFSAEIIKYRDCLIDLIMDGVPVDKAFQAYI